MFCAYFSFIIPGWYFVALFRFLYIFHAICFHIPCLLLMPFSRATLILLSLLDVFSLACRYMLIMLTRFAIWYAAPYDIWLCLQPDADILWCLHGAIAMFICSLPACFVMFAFAYACLPVARRYGAAPPLMFCCYMFADTPCADFPYAAYFLCCAPTRRWLWFLCARRPVRSWRLFRRFMNECKSDVAHTWCAIWDADALMRAKSVMRFMRGNKDMPVSSARDAPSLLDMPMLFAPRHARHLRWCCRERCYSWVPAPLLISRWRLKSAFSTRKMRNAPFDVCVLIFDSGHAIAWCCLLRLCAYSECATCLCAMLFCVWRYFCQRSTRWCRVMPRLRL